MIEKLLMLAAKTANCTFLYLSTSGYICFYLYYKYLQKPKTLPHELSCNKVKLESKPKKNNSPSFFCRGVVFLCPSFREGNF